MSYINSKATRFWVNPDWVTANGEPTPVDSVSLIAAGWTFIKGVRSDNAANTPNSTDFNHYGEEDAVTIRGKASRSIDLPLSVDRADPGQQIVRWAARNDENIGVLILEDGENGYAVLCTATYSQRAGDAAGVLRSAQATLSPIDSEVNVGVSDLYVPGS